MPVALHVTVEGQEKIARLMARVDPKREGVRWQRNALLRCGVLVQQIATERKIRRGGVIRKGGVSRPILGVLTSRTGTLRRSIRVDRGPLPGAVDVGSDVAYAPVHELGGTFRIPRHRVSAHTRTMAFGRKVAPFTVGPYERGPYSARFPKRPFLVPAVDDAVGSFGEIFEQEIEKLLGVVP